MAKCILRTAKIKSAGQMETAVRHMYRLQPTPNASLSPPQPNIYREKPDDARAKFAALIPKKVRKNAILGIEYLITASPDFFTGWDKDPKTSNAFFKDAFAWLTERHGGQNVVSAVIHYDETTPHLSVIVVPLDSEGKLNGSKWLDGPEKLSAMQTDFYEKVGKKHGIERGNEKSDAKHTSIREYYGRVTTIEQFEAEKKTLMEEIEALKSEVSDLKNRR